MPSPPQEQSSPDGWLRVVLTDPFFASHYRHHARTLSADLAKVLELPLSESDREAVRRVVLWANLLEVSLDAVAK